MLLKKEMIWGLLSGFSLITEAFKGEESRWWDTIKRIQMDWNHCSVLAFTAEEGAVSQAMRTAFRSWKILEADSPLWPLESSITLIMP